MTVCRFHCRSQQSGIRCAVIRSGRRFLIDSAGVVGRWGDLEDA
jgi:hypothetical protein